MSYVQIMRNSIPAGRVYYEDIGSPNKPVIVMQHGDGNSSQDWKSLGYVEKLSPHFRLILIDYLGYGRSDKVYDPSVYSMPLLASDTYNT
jgi:pimeloyl-ACP methyl ester carboxylesterase